jgi:hypothetical protein
MEMLVGVAGGVAFRTSNGPLEVSLTHYAMLVALLSECESDFISSSSAAPQVGCKGSPSEKEQC